MIKTITLFDHATGRFGPILTAHEGDLPSYPHFVEGGFDNLFPSGSFKVNLLDGLKVHRDAGAVTLSGNTPTAPVIMRSDSIAAIYLVMPVQVRE